MLEPLASAAPTAPAKASADAKDVAFEEWRRGGGEDAELRLVGLLQAYARKLVWLKLRRADAGVVNDAVWSALHGAREFSGRSSFSTWFAAIVINKCNLLLRREIQERERLVAVEELTDDQLEQAGVETSHLSTEDAAVLQELWERLDAEEQRLVEAWMGNTRWEAVAEQLTLPVAVVRKRWSRLMKRVRACGK